MHSSVGGDCRLLQTPGLLACFLPHHPPAFQHAKALQVDAWVQLLACCSLLLTYQMPLHSKGHSDHEGWFC